MKKYFLFAFVIAFSSCAPGTQVQTYVDSSLTKSSLLEGGITVLPIGFSSANQRDVTPELRRQVTVRVNQAVTKFFPTIKTIPIETTLNILEGGNLLDAYVAATAAFEQAGILRSQTLDQITELTKTRYALYPYLYGSSQQASGQGVSSGVAYSSRFGIVVWDKATKKSVYEGTEQATVNQNIFTLVFSGGNSSVDGIYAAIDASMNKFQNLVK